MSVTQDRGGGPRFDATSRALDVVAGLDLSGRNAIVTGGGSGLGIETARALAAAGAHVTIADINIDAARAVAARIDGEVGEQRTEAQHLDLGDLATVRDFAQRWGDKPLHMLVNNAGIMACPLGYTKDGFERQIGINYLGHFLLTMLLTPALEKGAPSRVVALSSAGHRHSDIHLDDPHYRNRPYHPFGAYGQSKTAAALFAVEYDRRYRDHGIRAFAVAPGVITNTGLGQHITPDMYEQLGLNPTGSDSAPDEAVHYKSVEQGAATAVWAAVSAELEGRGGLYLEDCAEAPPVAPGGPSFHGVLPYAQDPESARKLWDFSVRSVDLPIGSSASG